MELSYLQDCPTCGAPVETAEADRIVACAFCDGRNYMTQRGPLRFVLPDMIPREIDDEEILHIPYLRFKGHVYSCRGTELCHKIVDTTRAGVVSGAIPASLGLRPQAMKIRLVGAQAGGRFVRATAKPAAIFARAARLSEMHEDRRQPIYHRSFIGETVSILYLPVYLRQGRLYDGVLNREIALPRLEEDWLRRTEAWKERWLPRFIPTLCPHCGAQMSGSSDSLVLTCRNCASLWREEGGRFVRVAFSLIGDGEAAQYLPFWKIDADLEGTAIATQADFLRVSRQPVLVREEHERLAHRYWVPAFKIRPKYYLHAAKNLTIAQHRLPGGEAELAKQLSPVTLPLDEAVQSLKAVLTAAVVARRQFTQTLPAIKTVLRSAELVYLPFQALGGDLVQPHTSVTLSRTTLDYGRSM